MKPFHVLVAAAAIVASAACNAEKGTDGGAAATSGPAKPVAAPKDGDWTKLVTVTDAGGFLMGNPAAPVKLVEYGSMTCPHCADFEEAGVKPLLANYVKGGNVSFEFRNFVRDPFDLTAALVARCGGTGSFFALTRALYADQDNWIGRIQSAPPAQTQAMQGMAPAQQFGAIAKIAGFPQFAAMRGLPSAKTSACLANEQEINRLVQMNSDVTSQFPQFPGTPSFTINGELVDKAASWPALEPKLKAALGS